MFSIREGTRKESRLLASGLLVLVAAGYLAVVLCPRGEVSDPALAFASLSCAGKVERAYRAFEAREEEAGREGSLALRLGWSKAHSSAFTRASGRATLDPAAGIVRVEVKGLEDPPTHEVWLLENAPGPGRTAGPEAGDRTLRAGALDARGRLEADLGPALAGFRVDLAIVARAGEDPARAGLLFGTPSLFQRMRAKGPYWKDAPEAPFDALVAKGADLFFNETFAGNGRTCGSCHPAANNLTIDPTFIASLPPNDPLFVAEFVPALAENFEKPELMRKAGLILENVDGFEDLERRFVMRGVPHTLALATSIAAPPRSPSDPASLPAERTGWSGDGAPGGGTLREFANGAIRQHLTRTLERKPGVDFRFATEEELDAIEAFMLSLGRAEDAEELEDVVFRSPVVARGRDIFETADAKGGTVAAGKCDLCHAEAGASVSFAPGGGNFNFDTGVERLPDQPGDLLDAASNPPDGGLGAAPNAEGGFGDGTFNTPPLVEAADTGPFFHNNAVATIEDAVAFYDSRAFNESPAGQTLADPATGLAIQLDATQVAAVAAFLRVMNSLENLREAAEFAGSAKACASRRAARALLALARAEAEDGAAVLAGAGLHPLAAQSIREAAGLFQRAAATCSAHARAGRIEAALQMLGRAKADMVEGPSPLEPRGDRRGS